ncbi:MAG: hypothetical protein ACJ75T_00020 [Solirubrobacterales bacterium]
MPQSFREAFDIVVGNPAGIAVALLSFAGVVVGTFVDPVAGAIATAALLVALVAVFIFALRQRALFTGPYRVLEETLTWEFEDSDGHKAKLIKNQKVRFNYLAIAHIELASGDGELFADFQCSFGHPVRDGKLPNANEDGVLKIADNSGVLILLDPRMARDEEATLESTRTVIDGFKGRDEWIVHQAAVPSKKTTLKVLFPSGRTVEHVRIEGPRAHSERAPKKSELMQEGSRYVLSIGPRSYKAGQSVKVRWRW